MAVNLLSETKSKPGTIFKPGTIINPGTITSLELTEKEINKRNSDSFGSAYCCRSKEFPSVFPKEEFIKKMYNCLVIEFSEGSYVAVCGDAVCCCGEGNSPEDALEDLRYIMEDSIDSEDGLVFPFSSSSSEQRGLLKNTIESYRTNARIIKIFDGVIELLPYH